MISDLIHHAKILIIDDEITNVRLLEKILTREGYLNVSMTTDPRDTVQMFDDNQPDLILLDLHMPHIDGFEVMRLLAERTGPKAFLPIIVLTADATIEARRKALSGGATDLINKPFDNLEVALRIKNVLRTRFLHLELENQNQVLDERVRDRTAALERTVNDLKMAQQQVVQQERLRALGVMASGIAHDFNNILFLILAHGELLLTESESHNDPKTAKYLRTIVGAAQDGAQMVNRLAQFQRPASEADLRRSIPLAHLIEQAVELTMPRWEGQAMANGVDIRVNTDLAKIPDIMGDPAEIRELLTNMIFNAVDAMPQGGTITLRLRAAHDAIILEIEDTGIGMTEEVRQRCLEPFFTTKGDHGSGLGLAMIYGIVQRHGGTLDIKTQLGAGTKFIIRLPIHDGAVPIREIADADSSCEPLDILVVDNQPVLCEIVAEYLKNDWHRVTVAHDGNAALEKFAAQKFDLVITDKAMPHMSGDQLAVALRKIRNDVPIILLTGFAESGISESVTPEIDAVIGKPVNLTTIRHAIVKAVADRKETAASKQRPAIFDGSVIESRSKSAPEHFADGVRP